MKITPWHRALSLALITAWLLAGCVVTPDIVTRECVKYEQVTTWRGTKPAGWQTETVCTQWQERRSGKWAR